MNNPKKNAKKVLTRYGQNALNFCDDALDLIIDYNKSIVNLGNETEPEALEFERVIKFWVDTKEELKKKKVDE